MPNTARFFNSFYCPILSSCPRTCRELTTCRMIQLPVVSTSVVSCTLSTPLLPPEHPGPPEGSRGCSPRGNKCVRTYVRRPLPLASL
ncbi:hypothetical protein LZ32DRAFT_37222 [Colletotrichum eremochloae]|nr:hypothetical protein LZ32DRAFT_37222 [Colletotrichum eremochloae]